MKVVIVNEGLGYPLNAGNRIRTLNLLLPLAKRHDLTYVCRGVADSREVKEARDFFVSHGIRALITPDHAPAKRGVAFYARVVGNLFSPLPYSISTHNSPLVRQEVLRLAAAEQVDLWQFETLSYADVLREHDARTIIMAHNVESLIWQRLYETERRFLKRMYVKRQWAKYERYEARILRHVTRVVAVSAEDAELFRTRFGIDRVAVVDNGVDVSYFGEVARARNPDPKRILFLGSLDWRPNLDSLDLLLKRILPEVRAVEPDATLQIVGRNPPPSLVRLVQATRGVELHANVPDVRPFLQHAGVMAVPLRIGGGSRLKILEAAAAGVPVASTRVGSEGLTFVNRRDLFVVDDVDGMAAALIDCIQAPAKAAEMARSGLKVARERYDWSGLADRLEQIWVETAAKSPRR